VAVADVADVLIALGRIAIDHPEIRGLSASMEGGCLRCRIMLQAANKAMRLAIRPYPGDLAATAALRDGTSLFLRPVRPDDAPMVDTLFDHLTPDDVHTRFFSTLRTLPRALRARLTQIDYDREMALVAIATDGRLVGMIHLLADPDFETAEFAVMVRSDWQGRGVGHALMQAILAHARRRGLRRIVGVVLNENGRMLGLARRFGFVVAHGQDPGTTEVRLEL
jgi:acetyltransferase